MSGLEIGLAVAALAGQAVGTGISVAGQMKGAEEREKYAGIQRQYKEQQAQETLRRFKYNEQIAREEEKFAELGVFSGSRGGQNTGLGAILRMRNNLERNLMAARYETEYQVKMLRAGADLELQAEQSVAQGQRWSALGTGISGAASLFGRGYDTFKSRSIKDLNFSEPLETGKPIYGGWNAPSSMGGIA